MSSRRRIMLVEVSPRVPGTKTYATWNPSDKSANVTLIGSNLVAYAGPTTFGAVRANVDLTAGQWYWEVTYTTLPNPGYVMAAGIGVMDAGTLSDGSFGFHNAPVLTQSGPRTTAGDCYTASTLTGNVGTIAASNVISFWYDADAGRMQVRKNGGAWQNLGRRVALTEDGWYPMAQLSRNGRVTANFGASTFAYTPPHGVNAGVYSLTGKGNTTTLYLASEGLATGAADTPASTLYDGRIAGDVDLVTSREVGCWVWGNQTRSSRGTISIVATDGACDAWLGWEWRDAEVRIYSGYEGDARSAFVLRSVERVESVDLTRDRFTITLADQLALLDVALPRPAYRASFANASAAGSPMPMAIGRPLYCEGVLRTTAGVGVDANTIDLSSDLVRVDALYDRGDAFSATPADWVYAQDGRGVRLASTPDQPVTAHLAGAWKVAGSDTITGANGGDFTSWSGVPYPVPSGWTQLGTAWTGTNRFLAGTPSGARILSDGSQMVQMFNSGSALAAGDWRITFNVTSVTTAGTICFIVAGQNTFARIDRVGTFSVVVRSGGGQLQFIAGHNGAVALGAIDVTITTMRARALTLIEQLGDWTTYLAQTLGGAATLDTTALTALQTAAPYRLGHYADRDETILSVLRRTLDGWCGYLVPKRDGTLTVGRIEPPAAAADLVITAAQIREVKLSVDLAKGLTTRMACRRNHRVHSESEIASSVSAALRAELAAEWGAIRSAQPSVRAVGFAAGSPRRETVATTTRHADGATPLATYLQDAEDDQAEISRVGTTWRVPRFFYAIECVLEAVIADTIEPGLTANVTWPRYALNAGRNLRLIGVRNGFWSRRVTLLAWG